MIIDLMKLYLASLIIYFSIRHIVLDISREFKLKQDVKNITHNRMNLLIESELERIKIK